MQRKIIEEDIQIDAERIYLRKLNESDITVKYINWLNDPEVNKFLSTRFSTQNHETVRDYVRSFNKANNKLLLGIFLKDGDIHIGNVTFSHIDWFNNFATIGISIGDKNYWGKGYGYETLSCIKNFSFETLKLNRLEAVVDINNLGSLKLFKKVGFEVEGVLRKREKIDDEYTDGIFLGLLNDDNKSE